MDIHKFANPVKLALSILVCMVAGVSGGYFTFMSVGTWYQQINKPTWTPPNWLFGPVWTTLFLMLGIALYLIWRQMGQKPIKEAVKIFVIQYIFNVAWSMTFFGFRSPIAGLTVIIFLWVSIVWTMVKFYPVSKVAAFLLIPYLLWVSFATALNAAVFYLNL